MEYIPFRPLSVGEEGFWLEKKNPSQLFLLLKKRNGCLSLIEDFKYKTCNYLDGGFIPLKACNFMYKKTQSKKEQPIKK